MMTVLHLTSNAMLAAFLFVLLPISLSSKGPRPDIARALADFPGYHPLKLTELDTEARAYFLRRFPKGNPGVLHSDFDGDGHLDYALVLRSTESQVTKLVVLLCPEEGHCWNVSETDVSAYAGLVYLRPVAKGTKISQTESGDDDTAPVILKFSGIRVIYFGKGEVVLYWNEKRNKIDTISTAD